MCLSPNEPGGPRRCDGHAEGGYQEATSKLSSIITEQGALSAEMLPMERRLLQHRATANYAQEHGEEAALQRELSAIERLEADLDEKRKRARKLTTQKTKAFSDLKEKRADYYATGRGLQELQSEIDAHRVRSRDESVSEFDRKSSADEALRLQKLADASKIRMDAEEDVRLANAREHGWEYQKREVLPISGQDDHFGDRETGEQGVHRANKFAADRNVTMVAQGLYDDDRPAEFASYQVTIGNADGKTVTVDYANYSAVPERNPSDALSSMNNAPSRSEVAMALSQTYAQQADEPNFDKHMERTNPRLRSDDPEGYEQAKNRWRNAARERARLRTMLGDDKFNELVSIRSH